MRAGTRDSYADRVARVLAHMADHLDHDLDLDALADLACFSAFHFHRIYRSMTGETAAETLRRLRLHRAAGDLVQHRLGLAQIARRAGYGSVTAFRRAFQAAYRVSPAVYRADRGGAAPAAGVAIVTQAPLTLAGLRHEGSYMEIGRAFERLMAWAAGQGLAGPATRSFGIYHDDPQAVPPARLRSAAGLVVPADVPLAPGMEWLTIAGGRYAELVFRGPYAELEAGYRRLYGRWLPQSGEEAADGPCIEEYLNNPRNHPPPEWLTAIRLPLASIK